MENKIYQSAISGMHCAACSTRIEKVVGNLAGVASCTVNLATAKAKISYDAEVCSIETIEQTIANLGFVAEGESVKSLREQENTVELELDHMKRRLIPECILAVCIMVISMGPMVGIMLPAVISADSSPLGHSLIQFFLVLPVLFLGRHFYINGLPALFRGVPNMDSLIAIGTGAAFLYSTWNLVEISLGLDPVARAHDLYFESAAMLIALISLGKYLEMRAKAKTGAAIKSLMKLTPETATLKKDNGEHIETAVEALVVGDTIFIRPGERIPVDGLVVEGTSNIDESMLTGESLPVSKTIGDMLYAGTLNTTGTMTFRAEKVGRDTVLARIVTLVQDAQGSKAPIANLADRISLYFVPVVIFIALIAGVTWYFFGDAEFTFALRIFIAVMVIACPCAMGLATPTSIMVGTGRGAQLGVLIKTGEALERAQHVDCVVFDKTGTLTVGEPEVTDIVSLSSYSEDQLLEMAAGIEQFSEHPLAAALIKTAQEKGCGISKVDAFEALPGLGLQGALTVNKKRFRLSLGNRSLMEKKGVTLDSEKLDTIFQKLSDEGKTVLHLALDDELKGLLAIADPLKSEAIKTVSVLKEMGLYVVMLTGDNEKTALAVARKAGIDNVIAGVLPEGKADEINTLRTSKTVAMIGDGINDAPALALADVGIAMGTGIDVAMESADIVLMNGHLGGVVTALELSRATMRNIHQNLFWAFAYNVIGIPIAAGILVPFGGPALSPMLGGAAMAMSSVSVVTNALRLRFYSSTTSQ